MPSSRIALVAAPLALAALATLAPRPADACGGTFCDAGPQSMPVDQSGESILFVMDEGWVEAHVQIEYQGDPEQFAWIVPIMAEPEISVGSQELFDRMLTGTVPTFTLNTRFEGDCSDDSPSLGCATMDAAAFDGEGFIDEEPPNGPNQPYVAAQAVVGAFEYAVLQGGTAEGVGQWLDDNGYARDDEAPEVLQTYLDEGFMFVAFKLRSGVGVDHIHPVVLRYQGTEPCIPLRLTRIAAVEDMKVRAFFLGNDRVVPTNYRHVELNPLKIDWLNLGLNYDELVGEAIDEEGANGRAFVTEYAGPSSVVARAGLTSMAWDGSAFLDVTDDTLETVLNAQGFITCGDVVDDFGNPIGGSECGPTHSLIMPLVGTYMPPPDGVSLADFFACPSCYEADESTWDRAGFAAAFEEQIVEPAQHAFDVLGTHGYLTRLYTMISPGEMTTDPLFHERDELPTVSNQWSATRVFHCEENDRIELPEGYTIYLDEGDNPPRFPEMSAAGRIDEFSMPGAAPTELLSFDDSELRLDEWNEIHGPRNGGCECRVDSSHARGASWLGLMVLLGLRARGRRRRR